MRYYTIMNGLRGCYMPDNVYVGKFETRRELKEAIVGDCEYAVKPPSKREIASFAAEVWRRYKDKRFHLPLVLATGPGYGIHVCPATRFEYREAQKNEYRG